ncbi:AraC family transcriptional regulator [Nodosilinea sp. E11]|uniref:helix-turn-helix transcriptional regulator n=1 Tax=Nodosilinea sp. E11 TaxID=3037479 RepID=UPI00293498F9|nr:AraC family transcriptional regulator [Nodosilinea sp. E11]WOD36934.1 AraC family transcriptional regulator [Nodosilinea sp. E11]
MAITLSSTDYDELWQAANPHRGESDREDLAEVREIVPPRLGQGYVQQIQLRGIGLSLFDYHLHEDVCLISATDSPDSYEVGFNLSGNRSGKRTGENFLEWGTRPVEPPRRQLDYANDPVLKVDLHIDPDHEIGQLLAHGIANLSPPSQPVDAGSAPWVNDINVITPAMRLVLEQLWRCPFQGQTRRIFLEAKCLELIALKLEQLSTASSQTKELRPLSADDRDRIYAAQKILIDQLDNPPTLLELARRVNLNDYKLKVGFKQVFGTTVFGYLHQHRMETARHLLHSRRFNVKEVAQSVGYANQSRFAAAFRKQFGVNPKAYSRS